MPSISERDWLTEVEAALQQPRPPGSAVDPITGRLTRGHLEWLVAEVRAARRLRDQLVEFHDSYDSGTDDRFKVRGRIYRFLAEYDAQRG